MILSMLYPRLVRAEITENIYPTRDKYGGTLTTVPNTTLPYKRYEISETVLPDDPSCGDLSYRQDVVWFLAAGHGYRDVQACQLENGRTGTAEVRSKGDIAYRVSRGKVKRSPLTIYENPIGVFPQLILTWKPVPFIYTSESGNIPDYALDNSINELNDLFGSSPLVYIYPLQFPPDKFTDVLIGDVIDVHANSGIGLSPVLYRVEEHSEFFTLVDKDTLVSISNVPFPSENWSVPVNGFAVVLSTNEGISNTDQILFYGRSQSWDGTDFTPVSIPSNTPGVNLQFIDVPFYTDANYTGVISYRSPF